MPYCKHKNERRLSKQKQANKKIKNAVVGSLPIEDMHNPPSKEEPIEVWLNAHLDEPNQYMAYWQRTEYKPYKYPARSLHTIPATRTQAKYYKCEKHGLMLQDPPQENEEALKIVAQPTGVNSVKRSSSNVTTYTYDKQYDAVKINFLDYMPKIVEFTKKVIELSKKYPRVAMTFFLLLFLWWLSYQLQTWLTQGAASLVRISRPAAHWTIVSLEQFASRLRSLATSLDDLVESFYCDFSRSWCHRFEMMCDVKCSFMDKAIERLRTVS